MRLRVILLPTKANSLELKEGSKIPDLTLKDKEGTDFSFSEFAGKKPLVIYFYPKNFTPGCTREACDFRDRYRDFKEYGAEVIAISSDSQDSHARFSKKYELPFIFLSDPDKRARKVFGVKPNLFGLLPGRETFVFDKEGVLVLRFNSMNATSHIDKALSAVRKMSEG